MRSREAFSVDTNVYAATTPLETGSSSPSPRQCVSAQAAGRGGQLVVSIDAPEGTSEATLSAMILIVQSRVFDELARLREARAESAARAEHDDLARRLSED